ncbi:MAG: hypothetical protein AAF513_14755 [Pseudomonadota bacterium]
MTAKRLARWHDAGIISIGSKQGRGSVDEFLQGYLTCDTATLEESAALPWCLCDVKGRVLANGWAYHCDEKTHLLLHADLRETVADFLKPYLLFARCELNHEPLTVVVDPEGLELVPRLRVATSCEDINSAVAASDDAINASLIDAAYAWLTPTTSGRFLPQMLGQTDFGAVNFNKGCYLGQEIVARAQHRGAVKRTLRSFEWDGEPPTVGETHEQSVGVVVSVCGSGQAQGRGLSVG